MKGEKCDHCAKFVDESVNESFNGNTMNTITSIKDEELNKINFIPSISIRNMMLPPKENKKDPEINLIMSKESNEIKSSNLKGKPEDGLSSIHSKSLEIHNNTIINNYQNNEVDDALILDENGAEYYNYLEKTVCIFKIIKPLV
jgi:hypothetical protein